MTRTDYAPSTHADPTGGLIAEVEQGSPAHRAGLAPGDRVLDVDGHAIADVLDWAWHSDEDAVSVTVLRQGGATDNVLLTRDDASAWGVSFAEPLFDGVRRCINSCAFCFMRQLPPGMRPALYVRDDDFRLSFLQGNFVTLTNLDDSDVERIREQHLSPLYVSVHAVSPDVRGRLVCAREDRALERIDELLDAGVDLHVQIVLVPGINDGEELDRTLTWLAEREGVQSVGIVPLGYTRHQESFTCSYEEPIAAATVIQQVQKWQFAMRERDNVTWVHLADEFYLNARAPFPTTEWYDDFPQYENGIGMVRTFGDEASALREEFAEAVAALPCDAESVTIVTGMMAATTLAGALNAFDAAGRIRLLVVPNRFFGGNVSVTGLLTGEDLVSAFECDRTALRMPTAYLLPDVVFNAEGLTLDGFDLERVREDGGADVRVVPSDAAGLLRGLVEAAGDPPSHPEK